MSLGDEKKPKQNTPSGSNESNPQGGANSSGLTKADIKAAIRVLDQEKQKLAAEIKKEQEKVANDKTDPFEKERESISNEYDKSQKESAETTTEELEKSYDKETSKNDTSSQSTETQTQNTTTTAGQSQEIQTSVQSQTVQETEAGSETNQTNSTVENSQGQGGQTSQSAAGESGVEASPDYADYLPTGDPIIDAQNKAEIARLRQNRDENKANVIKERAERDQARLQEKEDQGKQKVSDKMWDDYMSGKRETAPTDEDVNSQFAQNQADEAQKKAKAENGEDNSRNPENQEQGFDAKPPETENGPKDNQLAQNSSENSVENPSASTEGSNDYMPTATPGVVDDSSKTSNNSADSMPFAPTGDAAKDAENQASVDRMTQQRAEDEKHAAQNKEANGASENKNGNDKQASEGSNNNNQDTTSTTASQNKNQELAKSETGGQKSETEAFKNKTDSLSDKQDKSKVDKKSIDSVPDGVGKPKLGERLSNIGNKLNTAKNIAEDPKEAAKQAAEQKLKEYARKAAQEAAKKAAQMAARAAQWAGGAASSIASSIGTAIIALSEFWIPVVIIIVNLVAIFGAIGVAAYCIPVPPVRGLIEYALTNDDKNLIQVAGAIPGIGAPVAEVGNAVARHSQIYEMFYGTGGICPDKNPDKCPLGSGTSGGGSTSGSYGTGTGKVTSAECAKLKEYKAFIEEAASAYSWPAPFIGAILSQETEVGLGGAINPKGCEGRGDVGGRGHGLGQVDQASGAFGKYYTEVDSDGKLLRPQPKQFPVGEKLVKDDGSPLTDKAGKQLTWSDCRDNIMYVAYHLDEVRRYCKKDLQSKGAEGSATFLKSVADGYNKWCGGVKDEKITAKRDGLFYGASVINRAADVAKCFTDATAPATPTPTTPSGKNLVDQILNQLAQKNVDNIPLKTAIIKQVEENLVRRSAGSENDDQGKNILSKFLGGVDAEAADKLTKLPGSDAGSQFLNAVAEFEGAFADKSPNIPQTNKNPGNIKGNGSSFVEKFIKQKYPDAKLSLDDKNHIVFETEQQGWDGFKEYMNQNFAGKYDPYKSAKTVGEYFQIYAPSSDGNNLSEYMKFIETKKIKLSDGTLLTKDTKTSQIVEILGGVSSSGGAGTVNNGGCITPCGSGNGSASTATQNNTNITNSDADQSYMATAASQTKWSKLSSPLITIIHYTASGTASFSGIADKFKIAIAAGPGNSGNQGWAHYMIDRDGKNSQFMTEDRKVSGSDGQTGIYFNNGQKLNVNDHAVQYEVHYDAGEGYNETINDAQLQTLAKTIKKSGFQPAQIYTHWGVQPYDRDDSKDWIPVDGTISPKLIQFIKYAGWAADDSTAKPIAKQIIKQNLENAIKVEETLKGKNLKGETISSNQNPLPKLQSALTALNAISFEESLDKPTDTELSKENKKITPDSILNGLLKGVEVSALKSSTGDVATARKNLSKLYDAKLIGQVGVSSSTSGNITPPSESDKKGFDTDFDDNTVLAMNALYASGLSWISGPKNVNRLPVTSHDTRGLAIDIWGLAYNENSKVSDSLKITQANPIKGFNGPINFHSDNDFLYPAVNAAGNISDPRIFRLNDLSQTASPDLQTKIIKIFNEAALSLANTGVVKPASEGGKLGFITHDKQVEGFDANLSAALTKYGIATKGHSTPISGISFKGGSNGHNNHLHVSFSTSAKFSGVVTAVSGSSSPCPPCTQAPASTPANTTPNPAFLEPNQIINPFNSVDASAAFGSKPTDYDLIKSDTKYLAFLKEIADTRGYEQYKDVGGKNTEMQTALSAMVAASGGKLSVNNTYRSYQDQVGTYFATGGVTSPISKYWSSSLSASELTEVKNAYLARGKVSAPPGFSQHSTGLAVDFAPVSNSYEGSPGYTFLKASAQTFGFKESYPKGSNKGAGYEPWHWQFVGNATYPLSTPLTSFQIGGGSIGAATPCAPSSTTDTTGGIDASANPADTTVTYEEN
jgi:LAS superfamily LD-carboxypeptidase LdcB